MRRPDRIEAFHFGLAAAAFLVMLAIVLFGHSDPWRPPAPCTTLTISHAMPPGCPR